eukprot:m.38944 g.38944  ORF g.38944 m.38944 type:complete len:443 (+) comp5539_c1_seq1:646-1974(+)
MDPMGLKLHQQACKAPSQPQPQAASGSDMPLLSQALMDTGDDDESSTDHAQPSPTAATPSGGLQPHTYVNVPRGAKTPQDAQRQISKSPVPSPLAHGSGPSRAASISSPFGSAAPAAAIPVPAASAAPNRQPSVMSRSPAAAVSGPLGKSPSSSPFASPFDAPPQRASSLAHDSSPFASPFAAPVAKAATAPTSPAGGPAPAPKAAPPAAAAKPTTAAAVAATLIKPTSAPNEAETLARAAAAAEKLQVSSKTESALKVRGQTEMFNDAQSKHSKIWAALNPQPLAFQSARERAEREETEQLGSVGIRSYFDATVASMPENEAFDGFEDADGGDDAGDDDDGEFEDPDNFDPHNLPDFGEFTEEMMARRAARAAEEQKRKEALAKQFAERKAREKAEIERELAEIAKREAIEASKNKVDENFVEDARKRMEKELSFGSFVFG